MAPLRETRAYLKPFLQRHSDVVLIGREFILSPVRHHVRCVLIDRTSSSDVYQPRWYIHHLFTPKAEPHIGWGALLYRGKPAGWSMKDPAAQEDLFERIEDVALPILRRIVTLDDFRDEIMQRWQGHHLVNDDWTRLAFEVAYGNWDEARKLSEGRVATYVPPPKEPESWLTEVENTRALAALVRADDKAGAVALLHEFERRMVHAMKLEKVWQPSPFPVERDGL